MPTWKAARRDGDAILQKAMAMKGRFVFLPVEEN
jgi:hypothetical protein